MAVNLTIRQIAAREMLRRWQEATTARKRALFLAIPDGSLAAVDVTEDVVSIMDRITTTMDWGSGFFDDDDLASFFRLADLLKIDVPDSVERPPEYGS